MAKAKLEGVAWNFQRQDGFIWERTAHLVKERGIGMQVKTLCGLEFSAESQDIPTKFVKDIHDSQRCGNCQRLEEFY